MTRRSCVHRRTVWVLLASLAPVSACGVDLGPPQTLAPGDATLFATHVQPYVDAQCATLDCHGQVGRPLRLYSELGLRREASLRTEPIRGQHEPTPITEEELSDNRLAFAGIGPATSTPDAHLALLKPLAVSQGGVHHQGPTHWQTTDDPGYRCLRGYLVGGVEGEVASACAEALAAASR